MKDLEPIAEQAIRNTGHRPSRPVGAGRLADAIIYRLRAAGVEVRDENSDSPAAVAVAAAIRSVDGGNTLPAADLAETAVLALQHNGNVWQPGAKRRRSP